MQCVGALGSDLASSLKVKVWPAASYGLLSVSRDRLGQVSTTMLHMTLMRPLLAPPICAVLAVIVRLTWVRSSSLQKPNRMLISAPLLKYTCPWVCRPNLALSPTDDQGVHGVGFLLKEPKPRHADRRGRGPCL